MSRPNKVIDDGAVATLDQIETTQPTTDSTVREGRLTVVAGRGDGGKTMLLRWMIERALIYGRTLYVADADPLNPILSEVFPDLQVFKPGDSSDIARGALIRRLIALQKATKGYIALDVGGNDREYEKQGRKAGDDKMNRLAGWGLDKEEIDTLGVNTATFYLLRDAISDLQGLKLLLETAMAKKDFFLVLNHGKAAASPEGEDPFATIKNHEIYTKALDMGAKVFNMPACSPTAAKWLDNNRMQFVPTIREQAPKGKTPLDGWEREAIAIWLADMEAEVERTEIDPYLP